ncbi:protein-glutamate methylesterase/protein-glutamine glutaminase [Clostridium oryzae]|nr:chemotaxis response regulator protein-glutamate methylesterase [Clostridium oryzae]
MNIIRVMVVEDSALMRKIILDTINSDPHMEVVSIARNGKEFMEKLNSDKPDVITLDIHMPIMDGIEVLKELRAKGISLPVIVLSGVSEADTKLTMECLHYGAIDFIAKPSGNMKFNFDKLREMMTTKIRLAYEGAAQNVPLTEKVKLGHNAVNRFEAKNKEAYEKKRIEALVMGASTGGPKALYSVITALPKELGIPILVVQHMPAGFTKAFAERLNTNSKLNVLEAEDGQSILKNTVYIAPGGYHMEVSSDKKIHLNKEPAIWGVRPAVDKLFISASHVYKNTLMSVVLTGMGKDGAAGTVEIKKNGGFTISEDESTCTIYGMPKAAFETGMVDEVVPLNKVPNEIIRIVTS